MVQSNCVVASQPEGPWRCERENNKCMCDGMVTCPGCLGPHGDKHQNTVGNKADKEIEVWMEML